MEIQNPNSSGQGYAPSVEEHPLKEIVEAFGYIYSHSTPITALDGSRYLLHTFKQGEHSVSVQQHESPGLTLVWATSTSTASGREWRGLGASELRAHLQSKARRYSNLKKGR